MSHMLFRPLPPSPFPVPAARSTARFLAILIFLSSSCRLQVIPCEVLDASADVLLCTIRCVRVLGEQLWCSVSSCQTDQFAHWHSYVAQLQAMGCASAALWQGQLRMHASNSSEAHGPG